VRSRSSVIGRLSPSATRLWQAGAKHWSSAPATAMATEIAKRRERGEARERRVPHKQTAPLTSICGSYVCSLKVRRGGSCLKPSVTAYRAACYESLKHVGGGREDETVPHLSRRSEGNPASSIISTRKEEKKIGNKIVKLGCYILEECVCRLRQDGKPGGGGFCSREVVLHFICCCSKKKSI
jgi:hypothetical protein